MAPECSHDLLRVFSLLHQICKVSATYRHVLVAAKSRVRKANYPRRACSDNAVCRRCPGRSGSVCSWIKRDREVYASFDLCMRPSTQNWNILIGSSIDNLGSIRFMEARWRERDWARLIRRISWMFAEASNRQRTGRTHSVDRPRSAEKSPLSRSCLSAWRLWRPLRAKTPDTVSTSTRVASGATRHPGILRECGALEAMETLAHFILPVIVGKLEG